MAAPSMVSRDGENTLVQSVDAVFGEESDEEDGDDFSPVDSPGSGPEDLPQCKVKRNYTCSKCDYYTQNPRFYLYHLKQIHKERIGIFECPHCLYASKHRQKLRRHIHMVHVLGSKRGSVMITNKSKAKRPAAATEKPAAEKSPVTPPLPSLPSPPEDIKTPEEEFTEDDENLEDEEDLNMADESEATTLFGADGEPLYKCSVCDMMSKNSALIAKHERVVHLKRRFFRCNKCNYMTHLRARYTKHVKYHSMPMIKCDLCDFKTPYKWNLDRHNKNHLGTGAFKCSVCNFAADIKQSLTVHELNHHIPPVGHVASAGGKRRLKVGASDSMGTFMEEDGIDENELDLLRLEKEGSLEQMESMEHIMEQNPGDFLQTQLEVPPSPPPFRFPMDLPGLSNSGFIQIQKYKCKVCDFSGNLGEVQRHESAAHPNASKDVWKPPAPTKRPIPNLIPIQGQSVLKPAGERRAADGGESSESTTPGHSKSSSPTHQLDPTEAFKKKNASFFDKLKERLMTSSTDRDLTCGICGFEAKCLSENLLHQKSHSENAAVELNSTRCQYCRQRCKSSTDLLQHLQNCPAFSQPSSSSTAVPPEPHIKTEPSDTEEGKIKDSENEGSHGAHPMENKVFVWNSFGTAARGGGREEAVKPAVLPYELNFYQARSGENTPAPLDEPAPSSGSLVYGQPPPPPPSQPPVVTVYPPRPKTPPPQPKETHKKVFKCPHCSFWASTASRFHVHIVGHLNRRPFQCSLCQYSSNWRWDITKHIRLKMTRDPIHERARVLLTDEAGRRNYSKYNKFLIPIPIEEFLKAQMLRKAHGGPGSRESPDVSEGSPSPQKRQSEERPPSAGSSCGSLTITASSGAAPPTITVREQQDEQESLPKKKIFSENKKTMWKCKKCLFRNSDRSVVLAHVKDHYRAMGALVVPAKPGGSSQQQLQAASPSAAQARTPPASSAQPSPPHSPPPPALQPPPASPPSLSRNGGVPTIKVEEEERENRSDEDGSSSPLDDPTQPPYPAEFMCETCPFTCDTLEKLEEHSERHFVSQSPNIKCQFCPFYAESSQQLLQHLDLHLDQNPDGSDDSKRCEVYSCSSCPYVAGSRHQLVYHLKWHQKEFPHKCIKCDYSTHTNIILSLHARLHGRGLSSGESLSEPTRLTQDKPSAEPLDPGQVLSADISGIETTDFSDIPMVWVAKPMGMSKMFKCRHCPFTHMRKTNIQDHEKLHRRLSDPSVHRCTHCPFITSNSSALSTHEKVHQAFTGQVCGIVDKKARDEEQIEEMGKKLANYKTGLRLQAEAEAAKKENTNNKSTPADDSKEGLVLHFCPICPARFLFLKEITIHLRFHDLNLPFKCESCTYTARQRQHLMAHMKVHSDDYKDRTTALCNLYPTNDNYPRPKVAVVLGEPKDSSWNWKNESIWVVVNDAGLAINNSTDENKAKTLYGDNSQFDHVDDSKENENFDKKKKLTCDKCPAEFFKELALSYHVSLHGGPGPHKCRYCDYAVKTYGNLQRHEAIHRSDLDIPSKMKTSEVGTEGSKPLSEVPKITLKRPHSMDDPEFGSLIHGNPDFIYPTVQRKGIVQNKRFKCHKCPSAFEKREQYKVHMSLHGSNQRFPCNKCDYSVKYYTNYSQHMKKHSLNESMKENSHNLNVIFEEEEEHPGLSPPTRAAKSMKFSIADSQTSMFKRNKTQSQISKDKSDLFPFSRCPHCPYHAATRSGINEVHLRCHNRPNGKITCPHCTYSSAKFSTYQGIADHIKIHYNPKKFCMKPDANLQCERLEIWSEPVDPKNGGKKLVFQDTGEPDRKFLPELENDEDFDNTKGRIYINLKTGKLDIEMDDDDENGTKKEENGKMDEDEEEDEKADENGYETGSNPESGPQSPN